MKAFDDLETKIKLDGKEGAWGFWSSERTTFENAFPTEFANMVEIRRKARQVIKFNTNEIKPLVERALNEKHNGMYYISFDS